MNVLVTGASGFLGRATVAVLRRQGHRVMGLDVVTEWSGDPAERPDWLLTYRPGMVLDEALGGLPGVDGIVHLAGVIEPDSARMAVSLRQELELWLSLLEYAERRGTVRRLVAASSVMVYDARLAGAIDEDTPPVPATLYGATKLYHEQIGRAFRARGVESVHLRITTVYGPGRRVRGRIPEITLDAFAAVAKRQPYRIRFAPDAALDMVYVDDAARGLVLTLSAGQQLRPVYNLGGGTVTVQELADALNNYAGVPLVSTGQDALPMGPPRVAQQRLRQDVGYIPAVSLSDGVAQFVRALEIHEGGNSA